MFAQEKLTSGDPVAPFAPRIAAATNDVPTLPGPRLPPSAPPESRL